MNSTIHTAREIPYQPSISIAEKKLAPFSLFTRSGNIVEYPANFCAGKIRVNQQPGYVLDFSLALFILTPAGFFEPFRAKILRPCALPHYSVVYRLACGFVPDYCSLALICDSYSGYFIGGSVDGV